MIDRTSFLDGLARQRALCGKRSPLYASLLAALEAELSRGEPAWFERLLEAWKGRAFATSYEPPLLVLNLLHYRALLDEDDPLRAFLPDCGGRPGPSAAPAFLAALAEAPDAFWEDLRSRRLQTNEPGRAAGWMLAACRFFRPRRLPFHLVDLGTSAGLTLAGDHQTRETRLEREDGSPAPEPEGWTERPFPVLSRTGLDAAPRDVSNPLDRAWLKACIWPDEADRHARFEAAADLFLSLRRTPGGPRLARASFREMPAWIERHLEPTSEAGLLVYNSQAADFLDEKAYGELRSGLARALGPWGDRGLWAEVEMPRSTRSGFHELRAHVPRGPAFETETWATLTAHPRTVRILAAFEAGVRGGGG